ncbi:hypothetical protein BJ170DRAFT_734607 [Xylariales sp. AK1849]|nr:hypothetical protein BJ170DRAFT_734607 [Xylariales sp. AK1849]
MGLRDMLKKKDRLAEEYSADHAATVGRLNAPEFTFIRSDTHTQEIIYPPPSPADSHNNENDSYLTAKDSGNRVRRRLDVFKTKSPANSASSVESEAPKRESPSRRLSHRLHLSRQPSTSEYVPENLPQIKLPPGDETADKDVAEREWEKRATILAQKNEQTQSRSPTPSPMGEKPNPYDVGALAHTLPQNNKDGVVSSKAIDEDIQEAIRLHEEGSLERSTQMFGRLADPKGANNPLSQVLYGLALRHGWGCEPDPARAVTYLSAAASNAAGVEEMALQAGLKKGGAAKGELVLAIFELANCFRHGWGIPKDPVAAKLYYETAANLGDSDAMNEVAWCLLEGFGCKKNKFLAAKYYRLAEQNGNKTLGNTCSGEVAAQSSQMCSAGGFDRLSSRHAGICTSALLLGLVFWPRVPLVTNGGGRRNGIPLGAKRTLSQSCSLGTVLPGSSLPGLPLGYPCFYLRFLLPAAK